MSSLVAAMEESVMPWITFSGAPASTAAWFMSWMAMPVHLAAAGCGEKTIELRALRAIIAL